MITKISIQNYRSFLSAEVELRPFNLVIGPNGAGKSNLLRFFEEIVRTEMGRFGRTTKFVIPLTPHVTRPKEPTNYQLTYDNGLVVTGDGNRLDKALPWGERAVPLFNLDPEKIAQAEKITPNPVVAADGAGTAQVLDALKNGDREDLFDKIEAAFKLYVPEVEKLSLQNVAEGAKQIQVREKGLGKHILPVTELSEGTRLILAVLTIIHQEDPPPVILLEDIDRGMHPRLFEHVAPLMMRIAKEHKINILATTHNPYLVDVFHDDPDAVLLVEKTNGASTLIRLPERLKGLDYDKEDPADMPLGQLWYSGLVGGVPRKQP
jgi:predicted ATPase